MVTNLDLRAGSSEREHLRPHRLDTDRAESPQPQAAIRRGLPSQGPPAWERSLIAQYGPRAGDYPCPRAFIRALDRETGEVLLESPCKANSCLPCVRMKARKTTAALRLACPEAMVTITGFTRRSRANARALKTLREYLSRHGHPFQWAYAFEPNPEPLGDGVHLHAWAHGQIPPQDYLTDSSLRLGLGMTHVQPLTHTAGLGYVLKMATHNQASLEDFRDVNGTWLIHGIGFWRDGVCGPPLTMAEAMSRAHHRSRIR